MGMNSDRTTATGWRIIAAAPPDAARLCVGAAPAEVVRRVRALYNLCGAAHGEAASVALGLKAPASTLDAAMRREIVRDHVVAVLMDWPTLFGLPPDRATLAAVGGLTGGDADDAAAAALRRGLTGADLDPGTFSPADLDAWLAAGATPTVRLLRQARQVLDPAWGRALLPPPTAADILALLDDAAVAPRDAGILGHHADRPLLRALLADEGASLFVRMMARLLDLLSCLDPVAAACGPELGAGPEAADVELAGVGRARAARGTLIHRAVLGADGLVADYRVLSPTVWALRPGGILDRMLAALPSASASAVPLSRLVLSCVNSCVPVTLHDQRASHAGEGGPSMEKSAHA